MSHDTVTLDAPQRVMPLGVPWVYLLSMAHPVSLDTPFPASAFHVKTHQKTRDMLKSEVASNDRYNRISDLHGQNYLIITVNLARVCVFCDAEQ